MEFPRHINLHIEHQPHATNYETVGDWLAWNNSHKLADISEDDQREILETGEIWTVQWYPDTPVGFCCVAAATLERALELAKE